MSIQKIAHAMLSEIGKPTSAKELAQKALSEGYHSSAKDPVQSLAQTLEKNVRDGVYNNPELTFVHSNGRRLLSLLSWGREPAVPATTAEASTEELTAQVPIEVLEQLQLADQAKVARTFDETVVLVLRKGLSVMAPQIKERLMERLEKLEK